MVELKEITDFLFSLAPDYLAESYDNVGLLVEGENDKIENVLVALDVDASVAEEAISKKCSLILSHHPLIFKPLSRISRNDAVSLLIKNGISLYSMHTNFDALKGGLCDVLLEKIAKTDDALPLSDGESTIGRIAELEEEMTLSEFAENVKSTLCLDFLKTVGEKDRKIKKIAICGGGGGDFVYDAYHKGADLYISGDFKYHHARFAFETGMALMEIPHYDAEILFIDEMEDVIKAHFGGKLNVIKSEKNVNPWNVI